VLPGIDHFLHTPGMSASEPALAPAAAVALADWAQPYAAPGA
jgi:hypothetical protein